MNPVGVQQNVLNPYGGLVFGDSVNPPALPGAINMKALRAFYNALSADFAYAGGLRYAGDLLRLFRGIFGGN